MSTSIEQKFYGPRGGLWLIREGVLTCDDARR
jgi:hypothetical protein